MPTHQLTTHQLTAAPGTRLAIAEVPSTQVSGPMREESRVLPDDGGTLSDPLSQDAIRARVIKLAFGGDPQRFDEFVRVIAEATPAGVEVILRELPGRTLVVLVVARHAARLERRVVRGSKRQ